MRARKRKIGVKYKREVWGRKWKEERRIEGVKRREEKGIRGQE